MDGATEIGLESLLQSDALWEQYREVERSVVCIQCKTLYAHPSYSVLSKRLVAPIKEYVKHGTGLVIDRGDVGGRTEYLILTNHHVIDEPEIDYQDSEVEYISSERTIKLVNARLSIVESSDDLDEAQHTRLEVLATDPDHDAAIVRTTGAMRDFSVYRHGYGLPKKRMNPGDPLISSGFPHGDKMITTTGVLTSMGVVDHDLPVPSSVYMANIQVDSGQSGSPVFSVQRNNGGFALSLIGMVYSGEDDQTTRMIMPHAHFRPLLEGRRSIPSQEPRLDAPISAEDLEQLAARTGGLPCSYDIYTQRYYVLSEERGCILRVYQCEDGQQINDYYLEILLRPHESDLALEHITKVNGAGEPSRLEAAQMPASFSKHAALTVTGLLNHFKRQREYQQLLAKRTTAKETKQRKYLARIKEEEQRKLRTDVAEFYTKLYRRGLISPDFWA